MRWCEVHVLDDDTLFSKAAQLLAEENVIGWFQGRMEFGPRALGGRSIIGDPRSAKMQSVMNLKIKYRESFRPFAPSVCGSASPTISSRNAEPLHVDRRARARGIEEGPH